MGIDLPDIKSPALGRIDFLGNHALMTLSTVAGALAGLFYVLSS